MPDLQIAAHIESQFRAMIESAVYPCVGAKTALARGGVEFHLYPELGHPGQLCNDLGAFARRLPQTPPHHFVSLVAAFLEPRLRDEQQFHQLLWQTLGTLSAGTMKAKGVSDDPGSPDYAFSYAGEPFFVVGLSPTASRYARRFAWPCLGFNSHRQFQALRKAGHYREVQKIVREREIALQGSLNPLLADFGEQSEAPQYSGLSSES